MPSAAVRHLVLLCVLALCALGAAYQIKGNVDLIGGTTPGSAVDLRSRDLELVMFVQGQNPFDYMTASQPPWGYPLGLILTWPAWPEVRVYFAVLNAAALAFLMWWAYRQAGEAPREVRLLMMAAVFAFGGSCTATEVGQISIVVTALLAAALWFDQSQRHGLCGLFVALAMIKPTIAAPFAVALVVTGRFRAAAAAASYGLAAAGATWLITGASPFHMLQQLSTSAASYVGDGTLGLVDVLGALGVGSSAQVALAPLIVAVPGLVLMARSRPSLGLAFAVAAVWGRLWTYHKSYDDVMLVFLLVPLGVLAFERRSRGALAAFVGMGLLAWIPGRLLVLPEIQMLQLAVWPFALAFLILSARAGSAAPAASTSPAKLERLHA